MISGILSAKLVAQHGRLEILRVSVPSQARFLTIKAAAVREKRNLAELRPATPRNSKLPYRRLIKPSSSTKLDTKAAKAIIVEGLSDKAAVQRAVSGAVGLPPFHSEADEPTLCHNNFANKDNMCTKIFVLGSSTWVEGKNSAAVLAQLSQGIPKFERVTVLMDPDFAGRRGRNTLETAFPGQLWHAFLPAQQATSSKATRWHEIGNVGIEHASSQSIRDALRKSRRASPGRSHFTREMLMTLGLVASHDDPAAGRIRAKRDMVCDNLGLGVCDGKQLIKQLNIYNFTDEELLQALSFNVSPAEVA